MRSIDINVDIGEGFPFDEELLDFATSANVCCGVYAGSWELTMDTIALCSRKGVRIGMHPGFPDRESMGRRPPSESEVGFFAESIFQQAIQFIKHTRETGYMKPHGAWYNCITANKEGSLERGCMLMLEGVLAATGLPVMLLQGSPAVRKVREMGDQVIEEGFADRLYMPDGTLAPRSMQFAVITDEGEVSAQVARLATTVDSICIHGDTPNSVRLAELTYQAIEACGFQVGY